MGQESRLIKVVNEEMDVIRVKAEVLRMCKVHIPTDLSDCATIAKNTLKRAANTESREDVNVAVTAVFTYHDALRRFMDALPKDALANHKLDSPLVGKETQH